MNQQIGIPETLAEVLEPAWLTAALSERFPGVNVKAATLGPVVSRISTNARFTIEGELPDGLRPELCVKGYFSDTGNPSRMGGASEARFYRDLAAQSGLRTLTSLYADVDDEHGFSIVITEDIAAQGAVFLDALTDYNTEQAAVSFEQLAIMHSSTWRTPDVGSAAWLAPRLTSPLAARGLTEINGNFNGPIGAGVPKDARKAELLLETVRMLPELTEGTENFSIIHGDAHAGNLFLDGQGRPGFVDWQLVQKGPWFIDVGYHLGCTLPVEMRREHEDALIEGYLDHLVARGVKRPSGEEIAYGISAGMVYGFFLWAITLKVAPPITTAMLERLGSAVADRDAFGVVARHLGR